jgi:D-alanine--D-alanine ligase
MMRQNLPSWKPSKVALLKGGWNSERAVSLESAKGTLKALTLLGYEVTEIEVTQDIPLLLQELLKASPDVVFLNALHGQYVEDGMIQSLFEMLGMPYTGSNVVASAMAMDKNVTREMLSYHGLPMPKGIKVNITQFFSAGNLVVPYPFVLKPLNEGSSVGVFIIHTADDLQQAQQSWCYGSEGIIEEFIAGQELSIALLDAQPLGVLELEPLEGFYDYKAKYTSGVTRHHMPARLDAQDQEYAMALAAKAIKILGIQGVSRVDMRYDKSRDNGQRHYILEANTLPGMTPLSIVPEIAAYAGYSYEQLCDWIVRNPVWPRENNLVKEKYYKNPNERATAKAIS